MMLSDRGLLLLFLCVASAFIAVLAAFGFYHLLIDLGVVQ